MQKPGFKLYKKFNRKKGLPLSCYKQILRNCGLIIQMNDLKNSMDRALKNGFAEKMARRYRMPWRLCDYHIARTLGVKGLTPPRFGSITWKDSRNSLMDGVNRGTNPRPENHPNQVDEENATERKEGNETADKSVIAKLEDKEEEEKRSAHYLITDYWNNMEGFFGTLETVQDRSDGDSSRPEVPLPQKTWQLKSEPTTQEPMWTFAYPEQTLRACKQEPHTDNSSSLPSTSQNETETSVNKEM